jgi:hypothetical protein
MDDSRFFCCRREVDKKEIEDLKFLGAVAQLGERLVCNQEVAGSIPTSSTKRVSNCGW